MVVEIGAMAHSLGNLFMIKISFDLVFSWTVRVCCRIIDHFVNECQYMSGTKG